jgi:hypothetical protein
MPSDRKGFSGSIGGASGASPVDSKSLLEADGKFDRTRAQPDKGADSASGGGYGRVPVPSKDPKVHGAGPSPSGAPRQPGKRK